MSQGQFAATALLALILATPLDAQEMDHSKMDHGGTADTVRPKGDTGPSSVAFAKANATMHAAMDMAFTGNADADFVRGMIAHHQGAIDMAKVELQYGKDAGLRSLAEGIIAAQEAEIRTMKNWLANNGG